MAVVDHLAVSTHHIVRSQDGVQQRRVILGLPGVQVDGRLVLAVGRWEKKPPFYACEGERHITCFTFQSAKDVFEESAQMRWLVNGP